MIDGNDATEHMGDIMELIAEREGVEGVLVWTHGKTCGVLCSKMDAGTAAAAVAAILTSHPLDFTRILNGMGKGAVQPLDSPLEDFDSDYKPSMN